MVFVDTVAYCIALYQVQIVMALVHPMSNMHDLLDPNKGLSPPFDLGNKRIAFAASPLESELSKGVIQAPPIPKPPRQRERSLSAPVGNERRTIFNDFWYSQNRAMRVSPDIAGRKHFDRIVSGALESDSDEDESSLRRFRLPPLPSPLERLRKHSGVYPLMVPKSILKTGGTLREESQEPVELRRAHFNLTETLHDHIERVRTNSSQSLTPSTSSNGEQGGSVGSKLVHFDPRVTVTELFSEEPRAWYSERDLERFKDDTVSCAKKYLARHPEKIRMYAEPYFDPLTKTYRKKALFSMFSASDCDQESDEEEVVRRILIVDRNDRILSLFRKSFRIILPRAQIDCVTNAEEALQLQQKMSYDIVVAEERLHRPLPLVTHNTYDNLPQAADGVSGKSGTPPVPEVRFSTGLSGSELIATLANTNTSTLLVGISKHAEHDKTIFSDAGADEVWLIPPPRMDSFFRSSLENAVISKRKPR